MHFQQSFEEESPRIKNYINWNEILKKNLTSRDKIRALLQENINNAALYCI